MARYRTWAEWVWATLRLEVALATGVETKPMLSLAQEVEQPAISEEEEEAVVLVAVCLSHPLAVAAIWVLVQAGPVIAVQEVALVVHRCISR